MIGTMATGLTTWAVVYTALYVIRGESLPLWAAIIVGLGCGYLGALLYEAATR